MCTEPRVRLAGVKGVTVNDADTAEVRELYAASYGRLVQVLSLTCGSRTEAEEVVQEAFVRLLCCWRTVSTYDSPESWVRLVAMRIAANRRRRHRNWLVALRRTGPMEPQPAPSSDAVDVTRALAMLPTAQRQVVVLHHLLDLPTDQIARELAIPEGTVKSRLARARATLAPFLRIEVSNHA